MCIGLGEFHVPCHSFFLYPPTEKEAYSAFISRVSPSRFLPFQLKPFSRIYAPYYLVARARAETWKPVFAMREPALAKNKSASDSLFSSLFHSPLVIFCLLVSRRPSWKKSSGDYSRPLHARTHQEMYRAFDHERSNRARSSINNRVHHLSSLFIDGSRWCARKITSWITRSFSFWHSGYFYAVSWCVKR